LRGLFHDLWNVLPFGNITLISIKIKFFIPEREHLCVLWPERGIYSRSGKRKPHPLGR
jgi:hypothetical protein